MFDAMTWILNLEGGLGDGWELIENLVIRSIRLINEIDWVGFDPSGEFGWECRQLLKIQQVTISQVWGQIEA